MSETLRDVVNRVYEEHMTTGKVIKEPGSNVQRMNEAINNIMATRMFLEDFVRDVQLETGATTKSEMPEVRASLAGIMAAAPDALNEEAASIRSAVSALREMLL